MRKKMISLMMTVAMGTVMISGATVVKADSDEKETVKLAVWSSGAADNFQKGADEVNKRQDKINFGDSGNHRPPPSAGNIVNYTSPSSSRSSCICGRPGSAAGASVH